MRRIVLGVLAVGLLAALPGSAFAQGVCINVGACNDYFFQATKTTSDTWAIDGYEYGCGQDDRLASGVIRLNNGVYNVGFTGANRLFDFGQSVIWSGSFDGSFNGTYDVQYLYMSNGTVTGHGASGTITVTLCSDPAAPVAITDEDTSLP